MTCTESLSLIHISDLHDVVHALIDLCARFIRQHLVDDPLVQPQLAAIRGNLKHIILGRVNGSPRYILPKNYAAKQLVDGDIVVEISGGSPTQSTGCLLYTSRCV